MGNGEYSARWDVDILHQDIEEKSLQLLMLAFQSNQLIHFIYCYHLLTFITFNYRYLTDESVEFVITTRGSVPNDSSLKSVEKIVLDAVNAAIGALVNKNIDY